MAIVTAGLALAAQHGFENLSVRRLADELGTTPATLYRQFDSAEQILAAVADGVLAEVELPDPVPDDAGPDELRAWLTTGADRYREAMLRYPGVADFLLMRGPTGPAGLAAMAEVCQVLALTGRSPTQVARAYDWLMTTVSVYTSKEDRLDRTGGAHLIAAALKERGRQHRDDQLLEVLGAFTGDMPAAFERNTRLVIDLLVTPTDDLRP
ncbi:MAG: TetR/AcrR family transcriptional regulator [Actinomycetota bacterium]